MKASSEQHQERRRGNITLALVHSGLAVGFFAAFFWVMS